MATQKKSPASCGAIDNEWTNPTYAYADDTNRATSSLYEYDPSQCDEDYYNFSFTIPAGSTINSVKVYVKAHTNSGTVAANCGCWLVISGAKYGTPTNLFFPASTKDATKNATFLDIPTVSQVNASDFGVWIEWAEYSGNTTPRTNHVQLEVDYTEGAFETVLGESCALSGNIGTDITADRSESASLSDSSEKDIASSFEESTTMQDTTSNDIALSFDEAATLVSDADAQLVISISESIGNSESITIDLTLSPGESVQITIDSEYIKTGAGAGGPPGQEKEITRSACVEKSIASTSCQEKDITT